jgi:hypothetical protein
MDIETFNSARAAIARSGFSPEIETRLALFIAAAKSANAMMLAPIVRQPMATLAHQFLHAQYCQELQAVGLLARVTRWAPQPMIYARNASIVAPVWKTMGSAELLNAFGGDVRAFYGILALGHALLSTIRLTPILPADVDETQPFVVALRGVERDNARQQQTQLRLLKIVAPELASAERDRIIETKMEIIAGVFSDFLEWICEESCP